MQIKNTIRPEILTAATGMLQPFIPEITPKGLVSALEAYNSNASTPKVDIQKPMTMQEVATLLGVSLPSIYSYIKDGKLQRVKIGPRLVRITPESVKAFIEPTDKSY